MSIFCFSIALTKLDILDEFEEIKICISYSIEGKKLPSFPGKSKWKTIVEEDWGWAKRNVVEVGCDD